MHAEKTRVVKSEPLELVLSRTFDAPRRLVFAAWSTPEHVMRWLAPKALTTSKCEMEFRAGGRFYFVMRTPDGIEFPFDGKFDEVAALERIVFSGMIHDGNRATTTVTFADDGVKTLVTVRQVYTMASDATRGALQGWTETLEKLELALAS